LRGTMQTHITIAIAITMMSLFCSDVLANGY
jgi:hypothetical protein